MQNENWPNFLIIGAGKTGTTSIDYYLDQHPEIFMSPEKEPNFFGFELNSESDFKNDPTELDYYRESVTDLESYLDLFSDVKDEKAIGEISNTYLHHENACKRIKKWIPDAKLIAVFRQPVDRLYSRYLHLARVNQLPTKKFSDCLDKNSIWWRRNDLIKEGFYYRHLSKFYQEFPEENIKVFLYEDLKKDSSKLMYELFEFLRVDPDFKPNTSVVYNSSGFIKNENYESVLGHNGIVKKVFEKILPDQIITSLKKNQVMQKVVTKIRAKNLKKPKLQPELRRRVTEIYQSDIEKLSSLINRDLSSWM